ncbi:FAD/NAD(P)-binding domain-containing protein [Irpex lacteus]|nr:FAD/NAD(P)-binding domain-containing protein [Irpex lacteus]
MTTNSEKTTASLVLDFLIVGGGESPIFFLVNFGASDLLNFVGRFATHAFAIEGFSLHTLRLGGLSAAYVLRKGGHNVRVLEKLPALGTPAAGLRVPPNMSKILKRWVDEEELGKNSVLNLSSPWRDIFTGQHMGDAAWRRAVMSETGGDFLLMAHEDVHRMLYQLAVDAGAKVDFGATVVAITPGDPNPTITLASGEIISADIIIGADGPRSLVREVILGKKDNPEPVGWTVYGAVVPESYMLNDPELESWLTKNEWSIGVGTGASICSHPVRAHKLYTIQIYWPDEQPKDAAESWYDVVPVDAVDVASLAPVFQRLLKGAPALYRTRAMKRDKIDRWTDASGRIVLLGEAAHPWIPGCSHPSAMALEDAVVFGQLFRHLSSEDQIPRFLNAYEELRQERTAQVLEREISNTEMVTMPPGPERDARDASFKQTRDRWDEGLLKAEFEGLFDLFGYDAYDAAEQWWVDWGRYDGKFTEPNPLLSELQFSFKDTTIEHELRDDFNGQF